MGRSRPGITARCWLAIAALFFATLPVGVSASTFSVDTVVELDAPLQTGDYFWDEDNVPRGRTAIVIDLSADRIYVYRAGIEIGRSSIIHGYDVYPTPTGVFRILEKDADHYSSTYGGAPMPWMLRLTWGGVAIHGSEVDDESATHGCIGVPDEFAEILYSAMRLGDGVLITRGWMRADYRNP
jgi:lipoprotein-anchoring transpeptidase ErfK/SrfK